jgi:rod shape determining protein RodA
MNVPLVLWAAALVAYGSVVVWSATSGSAAGPALFKRHLFGLLVGLVPLVFFWLIDYKEFRHWLGPLSLAGFALLLLPLLPGLGTTVNGQRNWIALGSIRLFQPSEPAKLLLIVVLAGVIAEFKGKIESPRDLAKVFGFLIVPLALIMAEPDLGTALVFIVITLGMLLVGGLKPRWFAILGIAAVVLVVSLLQADAVADRMAGHDVLIKQYQKDRLSVFLNPDADPRGAGYNLAQSKIAIGSGGLTGKGLRSGTQSSLHFIPERHTDFIFAILGEELGFFGAVLLLGLYLALLITALEISASAHDLYGALIAAGLISMWTFQILVNIGMTVGIMPITGIPLPFMSFGSSFMVTNLAGVGLLLSVWARRYGS